MGIKTVDVWRINDKVNKNLSAVELTNNAPTNCDKSSVCGRKKIPVYTM
jgi:hypothetical protein